MNENRSAAYDQLIQQLLECPNGEEPQILNAHSELHDPGLLETIITVAKQVDDNGNQNEANFLTNIALQLGEFLGSQQQPPVIRKHTADILSDWGCDQYEMSQFLVACKCGHLCLITYQAIHDRPGEAASLTNLGLAYCSLGEYERAITYHEKSLAIQREIKNCQGEAIVLENLAIAYCSLGKYQQAIALHQQSLAICREIKDHQGEAISLRNLGNIYLCLAQYEQGIYFHEKSLAISQKIEDPLGEAISLGGLGTAYLSLGKFELAIYYHKESLGISQKIKNRQGKAISLGGLGTAYLDFFGRLRNCLSLSRKI